MTFLLALTVAAARDVRDTAARLGSWLLDTPVADHIATWLDAQDTALANAINDDTEETV